MTSQGPRRAGKRPRTAPWWAFAIACLLCPGLLQAGKAATGPADFHQVQRQATAFLADAPKQRYRDAWIQLIAKLSVVARQHAGRPEAAEALLLQASMWAGLQRISGRDSDLNQALAVYEQIEKKYPKDGCASQALLLRAQLLLERQHDKTAAARDVQALLTRYPQSKQAGAARALQKVLPQASLERRDPAPADPKLFGRRPANAPAPELQEVRTWSNPVYTRVALYFSHPAEARLGELPADPATHTPSRIFVDIAGARLTPAVRPEMELDDALLRRVRIASRANEKVRVVLDLKQPARARVLVMENPYRLVVDALVVGDAADDDDRDPEPPVAKLQRRRRVVIDPGHGGHDSGAVGPGACREKDVALAIAKEVQQLLDAGGIDAIMTRSDDTYLSLEERTAIANRRRADAFVSIHANSAPHGRARGIETYYLNVTDDRYAIRLAAVENKTSVEQVSDLQLILADLSTKANSAESKGLAQRVQHHMVQAALPLNRLTRDLGVKASLFYVLLGARMPSILVETSFISNAAEAKLLQTQAYQRRLGKAIAQAVTEHLRAPVHVSDNEAPQQMQLP